MTHGANTTQITEIGTVFVPVNDQERALAFYLDRLGFEKRADFNYGHENRWIEVAPPGARNTISLVPSSEGQSVGSEQTYCAFASADIAADHATLSSRGVDVDPEIASQGSSRSGLIAVGTTIENPVPAQFFVRDLDGNRFLVVQTG